MSEYNWGKLISRLAFLAQSYKIPAAPVVVEVDGKVYPAEALDVETSGPGDIRLVVHTKHTKTPANTDRPGLGNGRPRKKRSPAPTPDSAIEDPQASG